MIYAFCRAMTVRLYHPVNKQNQDYKAIVLSIAFFIARYAKESFRGGFMYTIKTEQSFDAAHFLAGYDGKCKNLHGHRWRIVVEVKAEQLCQDRQLRGMVADFSQIKDDLKEIADYFDHTMIYEKGSLRETTIAALEEEGFLLRSVAFRPTAERFSKYIYEALREKGYQMKCVEVYETPNNCASYCE